MSKDGSYKLPIFPSTDKTSFLTTPKPQTLQCTGSATGNARNKCALKPGHSLMDWIRLGNSGTDLSGTGGRIMTVSKEELARHNTKNNALMAIQGVVYNLTHYMEFHPGGVEELMRGVGSDATKLFNETHSWVNYSQLLNKCRIGPLTNTLSNRLEKSFSETSNNCQVKPVQSDDILPRLDWTQKSYDITLYFYTKQFCNPGSIVRNLSHEDRQIEISILIGLYVHKFDFELQGRIMWPPKLVHISSESGKVEVTFSKHINQRNLWNNLGICKKSKLLNTTSELDMPFEFQMYSKNKFNHDSFAIIMRNENIICNLPVGSHLTIEDFVNNKKINKCYTPVPKSFINNFINIQMDMDTLPFLIKQYSLTNSFSQHFCNLEIFTALRFSFPKYNIKLSTLATHRKFCFLAAGSGLTPFLSLIDHLLQRNTNRIEVLKLVYFNKTTSDIWCHEILSNISSEDNRFELINVLSNAEETWSGLRGRVSSELLIPIVDKAKENITYVAACGSTHFITNVGKILNELNFPNENLFLF